VLERFWEPREIYFGFEQVRWLISNQPILRDGNWPPKPHDGAFRTLRDPSKPRAPFAPFESPALICAELDARLKNCGHDGLLTKAVLAWEEDENTLGLDRRELYRRVLRCLKYVSGWKRKRMPYTFWSRQVNWRAKQTRRKPSKDKFELPA
jgi:hypothetical protein